MTRQPPTTLPFPDKETPKTHLSTQACQKCGARFRWEREHREKPQSPLVLRLLEPAQKCDCGYGRGAVGRKV